MAAGGHQLVDGRPARSVTHVLAELAQDRLGLRRDAAQQLLGLSRGQGKGLFAFRVPGNRRTGHGVFQHILVQRAKAFSALQKSQKLLLGRRAQTPEI